MTVGVRCAGADVDDEPLDPSPGTACQLWVDTGDGDHRGAGHRPLDPACPRRRTNSRWSPRALRSTVRARRTEVAIQRRVPRCPRCRRPRGPEQTRGQFVAGALGARFGSVQERRSEPTTSRFQAKGPRIHWLNRDPLADASFDPTLRLDQRVGAEPLDCRRGRQQDGSRASEGVAGAGQVLPMSGLMMVAAAAVFGRRRRRRPKT